MINILEKNIFLLILFLPIGLVLGPAIADIIISLSGLSFLIITIINKRFDLYSNKYFFIFIFFCIYIMLLSLSAENILLSLESSLFYIRFGFFCLALVYISKKNSTFLKYFFFISLITISVVCADALIQLFFEENLIKIPGAYTEEFKNYLKIDQNATGRISGIFGEELVLGSFLVRMTPIMIGLMYFLHSENKYINLYQNIFLLLTGITILISGERTAFMMFLLFILLSFIAIKNLRLQILFSSALLLFFIVIIFIFNQNVRGRMIDYTYKQIFYDKKYDSNINFSFFSPQHEVIYKTAIKIFNDNKIFGVGPKMFRETCKDEIYYSYTIKDGSVNGCQTHPHNTYVQFLTETGILGFLFILSIFCYFLLNYLKYILNKKFISKYDTLNIFCLISILVNFWPLMPTGNFFNNWLSILYYLPIGIYIFSRK